MALRQDELVEKIRLRRRHLAAELRSAVSWPQLEASLRSRPLPWLVGGVLVGWAGMRFLARPLWRERRSLTRRWLRSRLREGFLALVLAGLKQQRAAAAPEPAARVDRAAAAGAMAGGVATRPQTARVGDEGLGVGRG